MFMDTQFITSKLHSLTVFLVTYQEAGQTEIFSL